MWKVGPLEFWAFWSLESLWFFSCFPLFFEFPQDSLVSFGLFPSDCRGKLVGLGWRTDSEHAYLANQNMKAFRPGTTNRTLSINGQTRVEKDVFEWGIQHVLKRSPTSAKIASLAQGPAPQLRPCRLRQRTKSRSICCTAE